MSQLDEEYAMSTMFKTSDEEDESDKFAEVVRKGKKNNQMNSEFASQPAAIDSQ